MSRVRVPDKKLSVLNPWMRMVMVALYDQFCVESTLQLVRRIGACIYARGACQYQNCSWGCRYMRRQRPVQNRNL